MDSNLKQIIDKFVEEIREESKFNAKRKIELWDMISQNKCKYCEKGIIKYVENGTLFEWECNEFLNLNCRERKIVLNAVFGKPFIYTNDYNLSDEIKKFYDAYNFKKDLIITGDLGMGKTSLLALLYLKAKKMKIEKVRFKTTFDLQKAIFSNNLDSIFYLDVFLLDDLGTESASKAFVSAFESIIDYRWRRNKISIVTTNLDFKELTILYPRAIDRIIQNGLIITLNGESKRRK